MPLCDFITIIIVNMYFTTKQIGICAILILFFGHDLYVIIRVYSTKFYFKGVQMTTRKKLCTIKGISEAKMEKIKEAANKLCVGVSPYFAFLCWVYRPCTLCTECPTDSGYDFSFRTQAFWLLWSMQTKESKSFASQPAVKNWSKLVLH